jgi:hypothetical protein
MRALRDYEPPAAQAVRLGRIARARGSAGSPGRAARPDRPGARLPFETLWRES